MKRAIRVEWKWMLAFGLALALIAVGAASFPTGRPAFAQNPSPDLQNRMLSIAKQLYCPVCVGVPLDVCETQACEQWRNLILEKLAAGQTEAQIKQYFIDQYGERVLGAPPPQGFNIGAYVLPLLILIAGAALLWLTLRGWLRRHAAVGVPATVPPVPPEYAERIARELRERE